MLKSKIALGYVHPDYIKKDTKVAVNVRGKINQAIVTKTPFVSTHYYRAP